MSSKNLGGRPDRGGCSPISLSMTGEEKEKLMSDAKAFGLSLSAFVRFLYEYWERNGRPKKVG